MCSTYSVVLQLIVIHSSLVHLDGALYSIHLVNRSGSKLATLMYPGYSLRGSSWKNDFALSAEKHCLTRRINANIARSAAHCMELRNGLILQEIKAFR